METKADAALKKEAEKKRIPKEYQEIYIRLRMKNAKMTPVVKEIREALFSLAMDAPELIAGKVGEELEKKLTQEYLKGALSDERSALAKAKRDAECEELRMQRAQNMAENAEREWKKKKHELDEREAKIAEREKELCEFEQRIMQLESAEARDRMKMYAIFKSDFGDNIQSTQNNTAFIAASGALLAGVSVPMSGDLAKISNKN